MRRILLCCLPVALAFSMLAACDDSVTDTSSSSTGSNASTSSGMGGAGSSGNTSSSTGLSSSSNSSGDSSSSSGTPPVAGAPGGELVNGGDVLKSDNYKMIMTFGQPTQNQGTQSSGKYKMRGGLIGATN